MLSLLRSHKDGMPQGIFQNMAVLTPKIQKLPFFISICLFGMSILKKSRCVTSRHSTGDRDDYDKQLIQNEEKVPYYLGGQ